MKTTKKSAPAKKPIVRPKKKNSKTVYIGNLAYDRDEAGIKRLFITYGYVGTVHIVKDPKTKKSKGFAFVKMPVGDDALKAIDALNGRVIDGRTLKVSEAKESKTFDPLPTPTEEKELVREYEEKKKAKRPAGTKAKPNNKQGLGVLFNYLKKNKK